ncbi:hypothetical protein MaudMau93_005730 [Microsporum audouinii]
MANQYTETTMARITVLKSERYLWYGDLEAEPEYTTPPKKVEYKDANPQAASIQDLTKDQFEILRFLKDDYKEQQAKYQTERNALLIFRIHLILIVTYLVFN